MAAKHPPIVVMSFNRPDMLAQTLDSLLLQNNVDWQHERIHLFQDGAINKYSRLRYANDADVKACIDVFQEKFPNGSVHASLENIGVCENFHRAETFVFKTLDAECAYFFEDDLTLSPVYFNVMESLRKSSMEAGNVAYFAAYGDYYSTAEVRLTNARNIGQLDHHWGFGLFRDAWMKINDFLSPYYSIVTGNDYQRRQHKEIIDWYSTLDVMPRATSQDGAKATACAKLKFARINTIACYAKYVGKTGLHMTEDAYDQLGFANVDIRKNISGKLHFPDTNGILKFIDQQYLAFKDIRDHEMTSIISTLPCAQLNPNRMCTREDVYNGYRFMLGRQPESESRYASLVGLHAVTEFIISLHSSKEFNLSNNVEIGEPVDESNLRTVYNLVLSREPDATSGGSRIEQKYDICDVARQIVTNSEGSEFMALKNKFNP